MILPNSETTKTLIKMNKEELIEYAFKKYPVLMVNGDEHWIPRYDANESERDRFVEYFQELHSKLIQPQQTVSKEIQFIKHTLKAIIRWHRDERNPKNFPISSTLDALNYLDKLQANQTNEVTECECGHTVPLDYAVTDGEHWTCMPCHIEWLEEKAQTNEGEFTLEDVVENLENNINELKKLISC